MPIHDKAIISSFKLTLLGLSSQSSSRGVLCWGLCIIRIPGQGLQGRVSSSVSCLTANLVLAIGHRSYGSRCSLVGGSCGLGINRQQWLLHRKLSGSHFSSSWYTEPPVGPWLGSQTPQPLPWGSYHPPPHSSPPNHPVLSSLPHSSQGLGTRELSRVPPKVKAPRRLGLRGWEGWEWWGDEVYVRPTLPTQVPLLLCQLLLLAQGTSVLCVLGHARSWLLRRAFL